MRNKTWTIVFTAFFMLLAYIQYIWDTPWVLIWIQKRTCSFAAWRIDYGFWFWDFLKVLRFARSWILIAFRSVLRGLFAGINSKGLERKKCAGLQAASVTCLWWIPGLLMAMYDISKGFQGMCMLVKLNRRAPCAKPLLSGRLVTICSLLPKNSWQKACSNSLRRINLLPLAVTPSLRKPQLWLTRN